MKYQIVLQGRRVAALGRKHTLFVLPTRAVVSGFPGWAGSYLGAVAVCIAVAALSYATHSDEMDWSLDCYR